MGRGGWPINAEHSADHFSGHCSLLLGCLCHSQRCLVKPQVHSEGKGEGRRVITMEVVLAKKRCGHRISLDRPLGTKVAIVRYASR